jgi:putative transcriptional regulator
MKLKNRLRVLRAEKEISQKDLADELDLSRQTINSIERGKFNPSIVTALKIAEFFKVPVDEVFKLEEGE